MTHLKPAVAFAIIFSLLGYNSVYAKENYNRVSLRAEASMEVAHDLMQVVLYVQEQDTDAARLAEKITGKINNAIQIGKQSENVKISLGNRHSQPVLQEKTQKIIAWREKAELRLQSTDFAQLSQLTGQLLQDLNMSSMSFKIADSTRLEQENLLMVQAIEAFEQRARIASQALGANKYKLVNLNLNSQGGYAPPMYRQAVMMSAPAEKAYSAPEIEAGSSELRIMVDAIIEVVK